MSYFEFELVREYLALKMKFTDTNITTKETKARKSENLDKVEP